MAVQKLPARSRLFPPAPCLLGFMLGLVLDWRWPWSFGASEYTLPAGLLLLGVFAWLVRAGLQAFKRHSTSADIRKETTAIIDTGPFRFSRNPGYLGLAILQTSMSLLLDNVWILVTVLPAMIVIHYVVVLREEAYLAAKFGDAYLDYKSSVRRWI